jgi:hypothetical protein
LRLAAFLCLSAALGSCKEPFGSFENPNDVKAPNYQGFTAVESPAEVKPESGWPGALAFAPALVSTKCSGAESYRFQLSVDEDFTSPIYDKEAVVNQVRPSAAEFPEPLAGNPYFWRVMARKAGTWGPWSTATSSFSLSAIGEGFLPASGATIGETRPSLAWSAVEGAVSYELRIAPTTGELGSAPVEEISDAAWTASEAVQNGSTWYWQIRALGEGDSTSAWSSIQDFQVSWNPDIIMSSPSDQATITDTTPLLDWSDASGAVSYELQIADTSGELAAAAVIPASSSQHQVASAFPNGATRYWRVRPINADGIAGAWGSGWRFTVSWNPAMVLTAPPNASTTTDTTPLLDWEESSEAVSYELQIADTAGDLAAAAAIPSSSSQHQVASALANGVTRYWRVRPINADGVAGAWGSGWSFTVNIATGVTIGSDMNAPLSVSLSGALGTLSSSETMTVIATVNPAPDSYAWYLDGSLVVGESRASLGISGDSLNAGSHNLSLRVIKGNAVGNATVSFARVDTSDLIGTAATPSFYPQGGTYDTDQSVTLSCATPGAVIHYTLDGSTPTTASTVYRGPIPVSIAGSGTTLKAIAGGPGFTTSAQATSSYLPPLLCLLPVAGGSFNNGSSVVTVTSFTMAKYEVTQAQYLTVTGVNPSYFTGDSSRPVERVTWYDAVEFCNKLSEREGREMVYTITGRSPASGYPITGASVVMDRSRNGYRLPTEAEWEYAARGGTSTQNYSYAGSDTVSDVAWYNSNSGYIAHAVGGKGANELGFHDMSGNVSEWCWDWYGSYPAGAQTDPLGASSGSSRVLRGGSCNSPASSCGGSYREYTIPHGTNNYIGFRVVAPPRT